MYPDDSSYGQGHSPLSFVLSHHYSKGLERSRDYTAYTTAELDEALCVLLQSCPGDHEVIEPVTRMVHELQIHRCELEMQNRALKETQVELEHAFQRYSDLYDTLPVGCACVDQDSRIAEVNTRAGEMLGLSRQKLIGRFLLQHVSSADLGLVNAQLGESLSGKAPRSVNVRLKNRSGEEVEVRLSASRTVRDGRPFVQMVFTDLSDTGLSAPGR